MRLLSEPSESSIDVFLLVNYELLSCPTRPAKAVPSLHFGFRAADSRASLPQL
jgi:hypothetical protein